MVPADQFQCFSNIVDHESSWNYQASNPSSGAYGLVQALPGSKMASAGADWQTNPATQIKWGLNYMDSRYGSPCGAWEFWQANHWY
nr:transglycosylase SLT domain-containing protein [Actinospica acidiphila]